MYHLLLLLFSVSIDEKVCPTGTTYVICPISHFIHQAVVILSFFVFDIIVLSVQSLFFILLFSFSIPFAEKATKRRFTKIKKSQAVDPQVESRHRETPPLGTSYSLVDDVP